MVEVLKELTGASSSAPLTSQGEVAFKRVVDNLLFLTSIPNFFIEPSRRIEYRSR